MPYKLTLPTGDTRRIPRVTEIIGAGMPKPAVALWELRGVATWAAQNSHIVQEQGPDAAITAFRSDREAANRGNAVHRWIATILKGEPPPALLASQSGYKTAFTAWMVLNLDGSRLTDALIEQTLTNEDVTVAGTADFILHGHLYDWKTVEKHTDNDAGIWPDHLAQLGAYASMNRLVDARGNVSRSLWATEIYAASIVRLYADGHHATHTITGYELQNAVALWQAVLVVAQANGGDRW